MIEQLPEGKNIGEMKASPEWIYSHTGKFVGAVRITIQDNTGFILIKKGRPLAYYFNHGGIELRGLAALEYINFNPLIEFSLIQYSPGEFAAALAWYTRSGQVVDPDAKTDTPAFQAEEVAGTGAEPVPLPGLRQSDLLPHEERKEPEQVPPLGEEPVRELVSRLERSGEVISAALLNEKGNRILFGKDEIGSGLNIAEGMLATIRKITPFTELGSFVHMTFQTPERNIVVAPFQKSCLFFMTSRKINIGRIRRILREIHDIEWIAG